MCCVSSGACHGASGAGLAGRKCHRPSVPTRLIASRWSAASSWPGCARSAGCRTGSLRHDDAAVWWTSVVWVICALLVMWCVWTAWEKGDPDFVDILRGAFARMHTKADEVRERAKISPMARLFPEHPDTPSMIDVHEEPPTPVDHREIGDE